MVRIFCILFLFALFVSPEHSVKQELWSSDPNPISVEWDTGYGFNEHQRLNNPSGPMLMEFPAPVRPRAIRITSRDRDLRMIYSWRIHSMKLKTVETRADGITTYTADTIPFPSGPRDFLAWLNWLLGAALWAALGTFLIRVSGKTTAAITLGFGLLLWQLYPGLLNPFNPISTLIRMDSWGFPPQDSTVLGILWSALYSITPSLYAICIFQALAFLAGLLWLAQKLMWNKWVTAGLAVSLLATPVAIVHWVYLERAVSAALPSCLLVIWAFTLLKRTVVSRGEMFAFTALAALTVCLRQDSLPFVLFIAGAALWRRPIWKLAAAGFLVAFLFNFFILERTALGRPSWRAQYASLCTVHTLADLLKARVLLTEKEKAVAAKVVNLDRMLETKEYSAEEYYSGKPIAESDYRAYLGLFQALVFRYPFEFLKSRAHRFLQIANQVEWWDFHSGSLGPIPLEERVLRDYGFAEKDFSAGRGLRGWTKFLAFTQAHTSLLFSLLVLVIALLVWPISPVCGLLAVGLLIRVGTIFLIAPSSTFFYLYDVYLAGIFLAFALTREVFLWWQHTRSAR